MSFFHTSSYVPLGPLLGCSSKRKRREKIIFFAIFGQQWSIFLVSLARETAFCQSFSPLCYSAIPRNGVYLLGIAAGEKHKINRIPLKLWSTKSSFSGLLARNRGFSRSFEVCACGTVSGFGLLLHQNWEKR